MLKLCLKIWAAANGMVLLVFAVPLLPQGIGLSILALLYSSLFSLPAIALLYAVLVFLRYAQERVWFSWTVLLLGATVISFIAYWLFRLIIHDAGNEFNFILPLSFICGYSSILLFSAQLNYWFEKFRYQRYENK